MYWVVVHCNLRRWHWDPLWQVPFSNQVHTAWQKMAAIDSGNARKSEDSTVLKQMSEALKQEGVKTRHWCDWVGYKQHSNLIRPIPFDALVGLVSLRRLRLRNNFNQFRPGKLTTLHRVVRSQLVLAMGKLAISVVALPCCNVCFTSKKCIENSE